MKHENSIGTARRSKADQEKIKKKLFIVKYNHTTISENGHKVF